MYKIDRKFLSFSAAVQEIIDEFISDSDQCDLFAGVYSFLVGGNAIAGEKECPPFDIKYKGIWYQPINSQEKQFYTLQEFGDLLIQAFAAREISGDEIAKLYTKVMRVNSYIGLGPGKKHGIWVETEMEKFKCIQCGNCCLNLSDACSTTAHEEDLARWEEEDRWDILDYIVLGDLWISPKTGEDFH